MWRSRASVLADGVSVSSQINWQWDTHKDGKVWDLHSSESSLWIYAYYKQTPKTQIIIIRGLVVFMSGCVKKNPQEQKAGLIKYQSQVPWENVAAWFMKLAFLTLSVRFVASSSWEHSRRHRRCKSLQTQFFEIQPSVAFFHVVYKVVGGKKITSGALTLIKNNLKVFIIDSFPEVGIHFSIQYRAGLDRTL